MRIATTDISKGALVCKLVLQPYPSGGFFILPSAEDEGGIRLAQELFGSEKKARGLDWEGLKILVSKRVSEMGLHWTGWNDRTVDLSQIDPNFTSMPEAP